MGYLSTLKLPLLGETMESGRITEWCIEPGEYFIRGQVLLEVETDKTIVEVPALQKGKLLAVLAGVGTEVTVGGTLANIQLEGDDPLAPAQAQATQSLSPASSTIPLAIQNQADQISGKKPSLGDSVQVSGVTWVSNTTTTRIEQHRQFVTPRARRAARQHSIDTSLVQGSGRRARVVHEDIIRTIARQPIQNIPVDRHTELVETRTGLLHSAHWVPQRKTSSTAVVLLHGMFGDSQLWNDIALTLASSRTIQNDKDSRAVCAIDLPGHGNSQCRAIHIDDVSEAIVQVVEEFDSVILVGHSYGGAVAANVAAKLSSNSAALMLIAPVGLGSGIDQQFLDTLSDSDTNVPRIKGALGRLTVTEDLPEDKYLRKLGRRLKTNSPQLQSMVADIATAGKQKINLSQVLETLSIPVSIVWGRQDNIVNWQHALRAPANVSLHLLGDSGHMPHLEQSAEFTSLLLTFCRANQV